jgi:hypothetical protein
MFDLEDTLTHEEILHRFKKLFGRDMTSDEKRIFFFPHELAAEGEELREMG